MVISIILIALMAVYIYLYTKFDEFDTLFSALGWITGIVGCLMFVISLICYSESAGTVTSMQAFYNDTTKAYEEVLKEHPNAVEITVSQGSVTLVKVPVMYLKRIEEFNYDLAFYRRWQDHWFVGDFISWVPDELKPIHTLQVRR